MICFFKTHNPFSSVKHTNSFGRTEKKFFSPFCSGFFTYLPMTLALLVSTLLEQASIIYHQTNTTWKMERERLAHTGPKGWACLSLAEPDMKYITSIYLTKDPKAKHQRNSKVTDYTRSMKRFHDVRHLKQTTENEKHLEAFKESQSASVPNKTNRTAFLIAWVEVHRVCRSSLAHERMLGVCCSLLC